MWCPCGPPVLFLSTPSARRATLVLCISLKEASISIHALREEGDQSCFVEDVLHFYFYPRPPRGGRRGHSDNCRLVDAISIHALREEGDLMMLCSSVSAILFLSTPSARRATIALVVLGDSPCNFYPRPPRGGRPFPADDEGCRKRISIHALREEGDTELYQIRTRFS